jgi:phosphodiesterase/alkaline phosphatase D-like protein
MRRLFGGRGFSPAVQTADVEFAWSGNVTTTTATVKCRSTGTPTLLYGTDPALVDPDNLSGTEGSDDVWTFSLSGLSANTAYYFTFVGWGITGKVKTFPSSGSFTIAAASCAGHPGVGNAEYITGAAQTSDSPAFDRIADRDPALFIHLGDFHYRDIATNSPSSFRTAYQDVLANARQAELYRNVPFAYIWDDHDYGANDSDGSSASKPAAQQVYREYVPHWTVPAASIYQTFTIGRVRFILLDVRSERSPNAATDNASKSMLGTVQKQWLKDTLDAATEPCIVICSGSAWNSSLSDAWGSFSTERQELAEFFEDFGHTDKLWILHGDIHAIMGDDGTNTQYDPGSANDGPPLTGFAPLDGGATTLSGTYTEPASLNRKQQYGTLTFTDTGTQITVTARAYEVNGASEVEAWSLAKVYPG